jgi:hypothetical protein
MLAGARIAPGPTARQPLRAEVLSKGLHRYDTFHTDAKPCGECQTLWTYMKQADEEQLKRIVGHMKQHFNK